MRLVKKKGAQWEAERARKDGLGTKGKNRG